MNIKLVFLVCIVAVLVTPTGINAIEWTNQTCEAGNTQLLQEKLSYFNGVLQNTTQVTQCQYGCSEHFGVGRCADGDFRPIPTEIFAVFQIFGLLLLFLTISSHGEGRLVYPMLGFILFLALATMSFNVGSLNSAASHVVLSSAIINLGLAIVCIVYIFGRMFGVIQNPWPEKEDRL